MGSSPRSYGASYLAQTSHGRSPAALVATILRLKYRDLIQLIESDGWRLVRQKGSHMQYRHSVKAGTVTVPAGGKMNAEVPPGTLNIVLKQAGLK